MRRMPTARRDFWGAIAPAFALTLGLAAAAPPPEAVAGEPPAVWDPARTEAVLVGVLEWPDRALAPFPKPDRKDRALERALIACGVPRENVAFLEDAQATRESMRRALRAAAERAPAGGTLLFYYAGHGLKQDGAACFASYDVKTDDARSTGFPVSEIPEILARSWKGGRLLLLADCCYSGALGEIVRGYEGDRRVRAACLTSATASNVSTERWTFTESLIAVLSGEGIADSDGDGVLTFAEADSYVRREMRFRESQLTRAVRTSSFEETFVLRRVDPARAVPPRRAGLFGPGDYAECEWEGRWWRVLLLAAEEGRYRVHYLGYDASWDEWVPLARLRPPRGADARPGDKVEVEWQGRWWPATVERVEDDFCFIRYDGWGREWDEWVTEKRMRRRRLFRPGPLEPRRPPASPRARAACSGSTRFGPRPPLAVHCRVKAIPA